MYAIRSYYVLPMEFMMKINGAYPFYECRRLLFESTWVYEGDTVIDRYGNEIVSVPDKLIQWESKYLMDASYRHSYALNLELEAGRNAIEIEATEGNFLLGDITLEAPVEIAEYTGSTTAEGDILIDPIQAEDFTNRNDSSIRATAEFDASLDPYKISDTVLNTVDSESYSKAGQKITYEFNVEEAGYYYIATNYRQSDKNDFPVFVDVAIDGTIPNTAFSSYPFTYTTKYKTATLEDENGDSLSVYLEAGTHTISLTLNNDNICHVLEEVDAIMSGVNDLALEITKVAGTNKEKYRDLDLEAYIPDLVERMEGWADELDALHESVKHRITSYNVCYTKLLRIRMKSVHVLLRSASRSKRQPLILIKKNYRKDLLV